MESLIHHFKLVTEGYRVPAGEVYVAVEGPRGELGCNLVSDGGRVRGACTSALPASSCCSRSRRSASGVLIADLIAILASLDPNMGDCDR